jgi:hypothetical protein
MTRKDSFSAQLSVDIGPGIEACTAVPVTGSIRRRVSKRVADPSAAVVTAGSSREQPDCPDGAGTAGRRAGVQPAQGSRRTAAAAACSSAACATGTLVLPADHQVPPVISGVLRVVLQVIGALRAAQTAAQSLYSYLPCQRTVSVNP